MCNIHTIPLALFMNFDKKNKPIPSTQFFTLAAALHRDSYFHTREIPIQEKTFPVNFPFEWRASSPSKMPIKYPLKKSKSLASVKSLQCG